MSASINATIHGYIYKTPKLLIFPICANSFSFRRMERIRMFGVMMPFHAHNYFQTIRICAFSLRGFFLLFVGCRCVYVCVILYQVLGCSRADSFSFITVITVIIFLPFICLFFLCMFVFHGWIHTILNTLCRNATTLQNGKHIWNAHTRERTTVRQKKRANHLIQHQKASWKKAKEKKWQQRNYRWKASNLILHSSSSYMLERRKSRWHF